MARAIVCGAGRRATLGVMKTIVHKARSVGPSWGVAPEKPSLKLGHILYQPLVVPQRFAAKGYQTMLVCEVALVQYFEAAVQQEEVTSDVVVTHQR